MRLPRRTHYSVVNPLQTRNGGLVIGQARNKTQAYQLAAVFGPGLWVVKVR